MIFSGFLTGDMLQDLIMIRTSHPLHNHIPDPLHTYRKCLKAFNHDWQSQCHNTKPYHHSRQYHGILSWFLTGDMLQDIIGTSHPLVRLKILLLLIIFMLLLSSPASVLSFFMVCPTFQSRAMATRACQACCYHHLPHLQNPPPPPTPSYTQSTTINSLPQQLL